MQHEEVLAILANYDHDKITIGVLGGHSALDVCAGAKKYGFRTVCVAQKGRDKTFSKHFKTREAIDRAGEIIGCVDETILVDKFSDILNEDVQEQLRKRNTIFIHNRYFWVYFDDFDKVENEFKVPIFGSRSLLKTEERDQELTQYDLLEKAGIRMPKMFDKPEDIDRLVMVKVNEATRGYERAFFVVANLEQYEQKSKVLLDAGTIIKEDLEKATIEEYIIGAQVNLNFFYSPLADEVELMGTDMRRQTSLDGFLRLDAQAQADLLSKGYKPSMVETGHVAVTMKESLVEKAMKLGEQFVEALKRETPPGIIGPFALQGAVAAEEGREEFVIFDVSMRIPGSPGTRFTPYSGYLYGENLSVGERVAMELAEAVKQGKLGELVT